MTALSGFGAVILAAGASRRLPGRDKLLEPIRGMPLIAHALSTVGGLGLSDAVVVTRPENHRSISALAAGLPLRIQVNPQAEMGMGQSLATGIAALRLQVRGIFVVPGDMPYLTRSVFADLAAMFGQDCICRPRHGGRPGHPVLFAARYRRDLIRLTGDKGGALLLTRNSGALRFLESSDAGTVQDIDSEEDFRSSRTPTSVAHEASKST